MINKLNIHNFKSKSLELAYFIVPWDTKTCGFNVAQIETISILAPQQAQNDFREFITWQKEQEISFCCCRMPVSQINESILLQENNFYFVEMNYHPILDNIQEKELSRDSVTIEEATPKDINRLKEIARHAFSMERFHIDPYLGAKLGNKRYEIWVATSFKNSSHQILKIIINGTIAGFFIVQNSQETSECNWLLTALAHEFQGIGYGKKVWESMLLRHKKEGINSVRTTISARNTSVMAIYSWLNFYFPPPAMTFHWHADHVLMKKNEACS